ncbi:Uncharacterised protein [Brucella neotomae]|nr:Uncharacterised protein [Brucella neotomae]
MNLYRALPKLQLISDDLVGLAAPQGIDHFGLALREHAAKRLNPLPARFRCMAKRKNAACRNKCTASHGKPKRLDTDMDIDRSGNIALHPMLQRPYDLRNFLLIGKQDDRCRRTISHEVFSDNCRPPGLKPSARPR